MGDDGAPLLDGIRVVDLATYIAAPAAATVLADFGADVIKIEPPDGGDPYRGIHARGGMPKTDLDYCWGLDARSKRSLALDIRDARGHAVLSRLIGGADVVLVNYPAKTRRRLKVTADDLTPLNPRLIYASLTGYGETGPEVDKPGFDTTAYWARAGILTCLGKDGVPSHSLPGLGDHPTAIALVAAIMGALYRRERTGKGGVVSTSLAANGLWANSILAQSALIGAAPYSVPRRDRAANALLQSYRTRDGRWFMMALVREERLWPGFLRAIERPDLAEDPRFRTVADRQAHVRELMAILEEVFATRDWAEWQPRLDAEDLTVSLVSTLEDLPGDGQLAAAGVIVDSDDPRMPRTISSPLWIDGAPKRKPQAAPSIGEHSAEVLGEIGLSPAEIDGLRDAGVIAYPES